MARGKYERVAKRRHKKKAVSLLLSIALILTLAVGGTLAYIITTSATVENRFGAGRVSSSVNENGQVTNNGNVDAYIRAAVVVNWMDEDGNVYGIKPNYSVSVKDGWEETDGFYYYTTKVAPNGTTATAPVSVSVSDAPPSDAYSLCVEIVAEAIQAEGMGASSAQDAWTKAKGEQG